MGRLLRRFDSYQQDHRWLAIPVAVIKKASDDGANREAALIAWWGFFSLFPLLLLFTAILGFALAGDPQAQQDVRDSALSNFPVVGSTLSKGNLQGSGVALGIGIVGALLSGMQVTLAAQQAFDKVYCVDDEHRPDWLRSRLRGLWLLATLGVLQIGAAVTTAAIASIGGVAANVLSIAGGLLINLVLFLAVFRISTPRSIPTRDLRPGIALAAALWTVLLRVGGIYTDHVVQRADQTYGTFALVIGLLTWLYVGARVLVYSAEINSVLTNRLWPKRLFAD